MQKLFNTILITGCGSNVAHSLCRILKITGAAETIIGCDIHQDHLGPLLFDDCVSVPRAIDPYYCEALFEMANNKNVDLIIPASEAEISALMLANHINDLKGIPLILANKKSIAVGLDKLATATFLKAQGFLSPWTQIVKEGLPPELPCILKMRHGQGSKNIMIIDEIALAQYYQSKRPDDLWQELLLPANEEYTCGLYRSSLGEIRSIAIKRKLQGGDTSEGVIVQNAAIDEYLASIAHQLDLYGSINVQLRLTEKGPVAFEINPRFSSTVVFRHLLGYEDFIWSLMDKKGLPLKPYQPVKAGVKFYRTAKEWIVTSSD